MIYLCIRNGQNQNSFKNTTLVYEYQIFIYIHMNKFVIYIFNLYNYNKCCKNQKSIAQKYSSTQWGNLINKVYLCMDIYS